jgi:hypothetical protein
MKVSLVLGANLYEVPYVVLATCTCASPLSALGNIRLGDRLFENGLALVQREAPQLDA